MISLSRRVDDIIPLYHCDFLSRCTKWLWHDISKWIRLPHIVDETNNTTKKPWHHISIMNQIVSPCRWRHRPGSTKDPLAGRVPWSRRCTGWKVKVERKSWFVGMKVFYLLSDLGLAGLGNLQDVIHRTQGERFPSCNLKKNLLKYSLYLHSINKFLWAPPTLTKADEKYKEY